MNVVASVGAHTVKVNDVLHSIYRVRELESYITKILGKSGVIDTTKLFDSEIKNKRGIIAFKIGWKNATGHIALFNGLTYREPSHDDYSQYINPENAGYIWANSLAEGNMEFNLETVILPLKNAVEKAIANTPMYSVPSEQPPSKSQALPIAYCVDVIYQHNVQALI
ncbi:type VI secretion system amidase effector protein Tae4 [Taylorella equigenitalis]|nr:T6SS effector amidase Tae4 family protein [Taylorella equigenitalis]WDU53059.1 type VI secretion system amidase effector protein Tae4 [Taylorella equigenitalis]